VSGTGLLAPGPRRGGRNLGFDDAQDFSDLASIVHGVSQRKLAVDGVVIAASHPGLRQVAGGLELAEDLYRGALGDPDQVGDVADPQLRVAGEAREHVEVVREERPPRFAAWRARILTTAETEVLRGNNTD
jgi:hypothetical protein